MENSDDNKEKEQTNINKEDEIKKEEDSNEKESNNTIKSNEEKEKEEVKEEIKEEVKEETKEEVKTETKDEVKEEEKSNKNKEDKKEGEKESIDPHLIFQKELLNIIKKQEKILNATSTINEKFDVSNQITKEQISSFKVNIDKYAKYLLMIKKELGMISDTMRKIKKLANENKK